MSLPKTLNIQSTVKPDAEVPVVELGATEVPDHNGGNYASEISRNGGWDGHSRDKVKPFLTTWTVPAKVAKVRDEIEEILEEGIPDQKRRMLRNQDYGMLDDQWIVDLAMGDDIERPFQRWSRKARDTVRVAICMDTTVACFQSKEMLEARMMVSAGLAGALEMLDYEVSIVGASMQTNMKSGHKKPRQSPKTSQVFATVIKAHNEPYTESNFAHMADTGLRRLMCCWVMKDNGYVTQLTDREWRDLTGADLLLWIGPKQGAGKQKSRWGGRQGYSRHVINTEGLPGDAVIGVDGEDTIRLGVDSAADVDPAVEDLKRFFNDKFGDE